MTNKIQVLLADDHNVVRQGLRALLDAQPDIAVIAEADDGRHAVQLAREKLPDVVVMDIAMPNLNGLEAAGQIAREVPNARLLVLSSYDDDEYVTQVIRAGARGYLLKQTAATDLIKAVREVFRGKQFFSPAISRRLVFDGRQNVSENGKKPGHLTSREREVLQLIAEGKANKQIAGELNISIKTVEKHRQQVMNKLGIHDIAGLTRYAISKGVVEDPSRRQF
ncbi:MAG TPA: response regulator transcription factor [Verrucomicrobiae bacterium]|nr:response regulator transcription factor [Verrucomicrobiae bacterium]